MTDYERYKQYFHIAFGLTVVISWNDIICIYL